MTSLKLILDTYKKAPPKAEPSCILSNMLMISLILAYVNNISLIKRKAILFGWLVL